MKKLLKRLLGLPVGYAIGAGVAIVLLSMAYFQGVLDYSTAVIVIGIGLVIALQSHMGSVVIKTVLGLSFIMFTTSYYTVIVMNEHQLVVQPFLLTLASITAFIAQTYSSKDYTHGIRSRTLWTTLLSLILVSIKITIISIGNGFWVAEIIGLNTLVLFIAIWRYWVKNSRKTKIIEPSVISIIDKESIKEIYINNTLDYEDMVWTRGSFYQPKNAYPYIYNEVMKAYEEDKLLVIISKLVTSNIYELGEIKVHRSKFIPYLYMEAGSGELVRDIYEDFFNEVNSNKDRYLLDDVLNTQD